MSDGVEPGLAMVLAEVGALRAENARLRGLLNLDAREDDGHRHAWAPTLFTRSPATPVVDSNASPQDKLALMRSLFGARTDVFALRWENASSGKSGWSPAVRGGWANKQARKDYLPLTDDVIVRHLRGEATVGDLPVDARRYVHAGRV